jgi:uncharacterized repeat protein (TIGR01451 family)
MMRSAWLWMLKKWTGASLKLCALGLCFLASHAAAQIADLSISKSGPTVALNGESFTYTLTISSVGPNSANNATFLDTLPAGLTGVAATCTLAINGAACPASLAVSAASVSGTIPLLPANGGVTILITGRYPVGGTDTSLTNNATVNVPAGVTDPIPSSNSSQINTAITFQPADLRVTKLGPSGAYALGTPVSYTVTLTNLGPGPADGTNLRDRLSSAAVGTGLNAAINLTVNSVACSAFGGATCPALTPPATVTTNNNIFTAVIPTLPAGGSVQYLITVTPTGYPPATCGFSSLSLVNTADITARPASVTDPVAANDSQAITLTGPAASIPACPQVDVGSTKSVTSTNTLTFGSPITYTVAFFNNGPGAADGTVLRDTLQHATAGTGGFGGLIYNNASLSCTSTPGTTCPVVVVPASGTTTTAGIALINNTVATFPVNGRITFTYTLTPQAYATGTCGYTTWQLRNTSAFTIPAGLTDPVAGNNGQAVNNNGPARPACPTADLSINKTLLSGQIGAGQTLTYSISIANAGPATATNVVFSDTLSQAVLGTGLGNPWVNFNQAAVGACVATGGATCPVLPAPPSAAVVTNANLSFIPNTTIAQLPPASSISFTVSFVITGVDATCARLNSQLNNLAALVVPQGLTDPVLTNNTSQVNSTVSCSDISTLKTVTPTTVPSGGSMTFTFDVTNVGPATASNVVFTDPLPAGFAYQGASCAVVTGAAVCGALAYTPVPSTLVGTITQLPAGSAVRYTIVGNAANLPGSWNNRGAITLQNGTLDPDTVSNQSAVSFNVVSDLPSISKFTTRANTNPGGTTAYSIVVSNPTSGLAISNLQVTDLLPPGWTYLSTSAITLNGGATQPTVITPAVGAATPTWGSFSLPPSGASIVISFVASVPTSQTCAQVVSNVAQASYTRGGGTLTSVYPGLDPGLTSDDVTVRCPAVGIAKNLRTQVDNGDGSFTVEYAVVFANPGSENLNPTVVSDPLAFAQGGSFGNNTGANPPALGSYRIAVAPAFFGACIGMALTGGYNGAAQASLANGTLSAGQQCEVRFSVQFGVSTTVSTYLNQARITATTALTAVVISDQSDDGSNPDPTSTNGAGGTNDPTPLTVSQSAFLGINKSNASATLPAGASTTYQITVFNNGPSGAINAVLKDAPSSGLVCTAIDCTVTSGTATCPTVGAGAGLLSIGNVLGAGVLIPRLNANSALTFNIVCDVTATGLP